MMLNDINRPNYINYFNVVTLQSRVLPEKLKFLRYPVVHLFHESGSIVNLYTMHTTDACHEPHGSNLDRLCQISKSDSWISTCLSVRPPGSPWTDFSEIWYWRFWIICLDLLQVAQNRKKITYTVPEYVRTLHVRCVSFRDKYTKYNW